MTITVWVYRTCTTYDTYSTIHGFALSSNDTCRLPSCIVGLPLQFHPWIERRLTLYFIDKYAIKSSKMSCNIRLILSWQNGRLTWESKSHFCWYGGDRSCPPPLYSLSVKWSQYYKPFEAPCKFYISNCTPEMTVQMWSFILVRPCITKRRRRWRVMFSTFDPLTSYYRWP